MSEHAKVQAAADEAELTIDEPLPDGARGRRINKSVSLAVRVSAEVADSVEALATELEMTTSDLIRGWISSGLAAQKSASAATLIDQVQAELNRLRNIVA